MLLLLLILCEVTVMIDLKMQQEATGVLLWNVTYFEEIFDTLWKEVDNFEINNLSCGSLNEDTYIYIFLWELSFTENFILYLCFPLFCTCIVTLCQQRGPLAHLRFIICHTEAMF